MSKKLVSSLLALAGYTTVMWFSSTAASAAKQCPSGYFVTHDNMGATVPATGEYEVSRAKFCRLVRDFPSL